MFFYSHLQWGKQPFPGELLDSCGLLCDLFILFCSYTPLLTLPFHMFREGFGIHFIGVLSYLVVRSRQQSIPNSACIDCRGALRKACVGQGLNGSTASAGRGKTKEAALPGPLYVSKPQLQLSSQVNKTKCVYNAGFNFLSKSGMFCFLPEELLIDIDSLFE